jgi:hypothetical protein
VLRRGRKEQSAASRPAGRPARPASLASGRSLCRSQNQGPACKSPISRSLEAVAELWHPTPFSEGRLINPGLCAQARITAPRFPHCFPAGTGKAGGTVQIAFEGLRPNREIHALLGPELVLHGVKTDATGSGRISFPIPAGTRPGKHLVTIGHNGLAITADCTLTVRK